MRAFVPAATWSALGLCVVAFAICGCGQNGAQSQGAGSAPVAEPAPLPPAEFTAAQKQQALASLPAAFRGADLDNGEAKFALCRSCHTAVFRGGTLVGPNLYNVFGRRAGTLPGFAYSDALKGSKIVWRAETIDHWIENPRADVPGTKMTFLGLENPKDRIDVIAYLKLISTPPDR